MLSNFVELLYRQLSISCLWFLVKYDILIIVMRSIYSLLIRKGELVNWLPVCKSKYLFLKVLARLNSGIQIILWFNGIYDSKLELTKPNRLNQLLEHDKIISDQAPRWEKAHFKRRSNSSFFFCKIKFHLCNSGYESGWQSDQLIFSADMVWDWSH